MKISETDLAYIAGIIDTMGRLTTRPTKAGLLPVVELNVKNPPLLEWMSEITRAASFTTSREYQRFGCQEHCAEQHVHTVSTSMRWSVTGAKATILLHAILPYMRLRADDARALLELGLAAEMRSQTVRDMTENGFALPPDAILTKPAADLVA